MDRTAQATSHCHVRRAFRVIGLVFDDWPIVAECVGFIEGGEEVGWSSCSVGYGEQF